MKQPGLEKDMDVPEPWEQLERRSQAPLGPYLYLSSQLLFFNSFFLLRTIFVCIIENIGSEHPNFLQRLYILVIRKYGP